MENTLTHQNEFDLRTIHSLSNYIFLVEDYQRGYQWDEQQVLDLLEDIDQFDPDSNGQQFYCLQPVAVKRIIGQELDDIVDNENLDLEYSEFVYELVDGQQRLTTIFLILKLLSVDTNHHQVIYRTRDRSKEYLESIQEVNIDSNIDVKQKIEELQNMLNGSWENYLEDNVQFDNVDNYHFYKAAQLVGNYQFLDKERFIDKLFNKTQVIWYNEIFKSPKKLFADLNSGKIKLTGSELIKALFVLDISKQYSMNSEVAQFQVNELASEWDEVEYQLQQNDFWFFIKSETKREYLSRIGYLFDVLHDATDKKDDLYTYRLYANENKKPDWDELKSFFQKLVEWYNDPYIYHRIGFLIFQRDNNLNTLKKIKDKSNSVTKKEFKQELNDEISKAFKKERKGEQLYNLENLSYTRSKNNITHILILFNIHLYEKIMGNSKINFEEFYQRNWTLEHIFPQNMSSVKDRDEALELFTEYDQIVEKSGEQRKIYTSLLKNLNSISEKDFPKLRGDLKNFIDDLVEKFDLDQIGNLTLLNQRENSSIGNKPFKAKRKEIIKFNQGENKMEGKICFIPLGTLHVFTKFYTINENEVQLTYWSPKDADRYKAAIAQSLKKYLPV